MIWTQNKNFRFINLLKIKQFDRHNEDNKTDIKKKKNVIIMMWYQRQYFICEYNIRVHVYWLDNTESVRKYTNERLTHAKALSSVYTKYIHNIRP